MKIKDNVLFWLMICPAYLSSDQITWVETLLGVVTVINFFIFIIWILAHSIKD
jgi:cytosine/uracil/thiamine/allantoin permease